MDQWLRHIAIPYLEQPITFLYYPRRCLALRRVDKPTPLGLLSSPEKGQWEVTFPETGEELGQLYPLTAVYRLEIANRAVNQSLAYVSLVCE